VTAEIETPEELDKEWVRLRRREASKAGMSRVEARLFAESEIDVGDLRRLVEKGCPPELIARVLL
jgi:hypothetical protein